MLFGVVYASRVTLFRNRSLTVADRWFGWRHVKPRLGAQWEGHSRVETIWPVLAPIVLTTAAVILFKLALRQPGMVHWKLLGIGFLSVVLLCIYVGSLASEGSWGGIFGFLVVLFLSLTSLLYGAALAMSLRGRRRLVAGFVALVLPIIWLVSLEGGDAHSPEASFQANGNLIVEALNQYHL